MQRAMLVVGCNCWDEDLCDKHCDPPGGVRPRPALGPSIGGVALLLMVLTRSGSMLVAASGRKTIGPKKQ